MSISLHPGTDLARHSGSFLQRIGQLFKFAAFYVISCGDLSFLTDESKATTDFSTHARNRAEDVDTNLETGELPDMNGIDIAGSHGAITSLYAGSAPDAGDFNGKVCFSCLRHSGCVGMSNDFSPQYLTAWARLTLPHPKALNIDTQKKLWDWCEDQVKDIGNKAAA